MMKYVLTGTHKESWIMNNAKIKEEFKVTEENFSTDSIFSFKKTIKRKCNETFKDKLQIEAESRSKMKYYLDGKKEWKIMNRPDYMNKLNRKQVGTIYRARTRMLDIIPSEIKLRRW